MVLVFSLKTFAKPSRTQWVRLLLLLSHFSRVRLCVTPQTAAHQAPPSPGFSRQEHWSGLPFPSPMHESEKWKGSRSVVSNPQRPHGLQPTRLLHPWDSPGKRTAGAECLCLLWTMSECNTNELWVPETRKGGHTKCIKKEKLPTRDTNYKLNLPSGFKNWTKKDGQEIALIPKDELTTQ